MKDNEPLLNEDKKTSNTDENNVIDTSNIDEQWNSLTQDWQSQPVEKTDIQALLKQTKRRTAWAKTCLGLNIIATVGLFISFIYGIFKGEFGTPWNIYLGGGGFMSLIFVYYEVKIRAKTWSQISDSPDKAIENALAGCESSMKYMALTKWSCLPFGVLANWFVYSIGQQGDKPVLGAFIFINVFIAVMYLITELIHRKRKREFKKLTDKVSNL
ncbi:MAG: hypothetical protein P8I03_12885 [Thalassotalea sp.]|nr:hypothetical protein [Thalassotalea sp.]